MLEALTRPGIEHATSSDNQTPSRQPWRRAAPPPPPDVRVVGGWASPSVMRVCVALRLKGVAYEFLQEELGKKSGLLLASNPVHKKMPVLLHGGRPVCESLVIVEYVDETFAGSGRRILPADPYDRAVHRFWAEYADAKVKSRSAAISVGNRIRGLVTDLPLPTALRTLMGMIGGDKAEAAEQLEEAFAACSKGRGFFAGDDVGFLDIVLGSYVGWFRAAEQITGKPVLDEARTPRLAAWAARFCAHEAVGDLMPDAGRLVEFGEALRAALAANATQP
ncbi:hypothetical protein HU200_050343 [Digitaria exilis]|uniref:glutathione transferase n=1 Tax=Digitaria exilis TaxID=1010633 RepID=A0A835B3B0_9POAL|nr:hypothetical protein HU200_050343 [Digitaria exilis]